MAGDSDQQRRRRMHLEVVGAMIADIRRQMPLATPHPQLRDTIFSAFSSRGVPSLDIFTEVVISRFRIGMMHPPIVTGITRKLLIVREIESPSVKITIWVPVPSRPPPFLPKQLRSFLLRWSQRLMATAAMTARLAPVMTTAAVAAAAAVAVTVAVTVAVAVAVAVAVVVTVAVAPAPTAVGVGEKGAGRGAAVPAMAMADGGGDFPPVANLPRVVKSPPAFPLVVCGPEALLAAEAPADTAEGGGETPLRAAAAGVLLGVGATADLVVGGRPAAPPTTTSAGRHALVVATLVAAGRDTWPTLG
ncbi:hypothetical protein MMPV_008131 [Pyropia vietnamensis]